MIFWVVISTMLHGLSLMDEWSHGRLAMKIAGIDKYKKE